LEELANQEVTLSQHFQDHILDCWFPSAIDSVNGGFHQNFGEDWAELPDTSRSLVYHARLIWLAAAGGQTDIADEGCRTLWEKFWDRDYGGFVWEIGLDGSVINPEKHLYGNAFAIFALAKAGKKDDANWAFQWFDLHAHDDEHGGYIETCWSDGEQNLSSDGKDALGTPYGLKSMNSNLHIMEALIELYSLSRDSKVRDRLAETFSTFRTAFAKSDGKLIYYVTKDLIPASDIDSYGHAMEAAFLMIEAAEALDQDIDTTWNLAKTMVDRTIAAGWDNRNGGMFNEGHFDQPAYDKNKIWWVQAESLNVLRLMAKEFGEPYLALYQQQWTFIKNHMIDYDHKGWRPAVKEDGSQISNLNKSDAWTEGYHQGRATSIL